MCNLRFYLLAFLMLFSLVHGSTMVYVTSQNSQVAVLDADNNTFLTNFTPSIGSTTASTLTGVAISPDQTTAYIADNGNKGLWIINTSDNSTRAFVSLPAASFPLEVNVTPDGSKVYISDFGAGIVYDMLTANNSVSTISGGATKPAGLAFNPSGSKLYVTDDASANIFAYNTSNDSFITTIAGARSLFAAVNGAGIGYETDIASNLVYSFNTATDTPLGTIATSGTDLSGVAFTSDGTTAYVGSNGDNTLQVIVSGVPGSPISLTHPPFEVAINPVNNQQVYLTANPASTVMVVENGSQVAAPDFDANLTSAFFLAYFQSSPSPSPSAPTSLVGKVIKDRFVLQTDIVHRLTWSASSSSNVVSYVISRNGVQIATIPADGKLRYDDHNRSPDEVDFYQVSAVDANGNQSTPASVTVP
jgi:DNA-binding beta-propeller fold protein YncE